MNEVQKADPTLRRNALLILIAGMCLGAIPFLLLLEYQQSIELWLFYNGEYFVKNPESIAVILFILILPILVASIYFWMLADKIISTRRYPPAEQKVIKDTMIYTGDDAIKRGYLLKFLCVLLFTACLSIPPLFLFMVKQLSTMFTM